MIAKAACLLPLIVLAVCNPVARHTSDDLWELRQRSGDIVLPATDMKRYLRGTDPLAVAWITFYTADGIEREDEATCLSKMGSFPCDFTVDSTQKLDCDFLTRIHMDLAVIQNHFGVAVQSLNQNSSNLGTISGKMELLKQRVEEMRANVVPTWCPPASDTAMEQKVGSESGCNGGNLSDCIERVYRLVHQTWNYADKLDKFFFDAMASTL